MILVEYLLTQQGMSFAMTQVSGRRANELGDLMTVLKLGAVYLDHRAGVLDQCFSRSLDNPRFPGTRRSEEQKVADRAARSAHAREVHLIDVDNLLDRLLLPHDQ